MLLFCVGGISRREQPDTATRDRLAINLLGAPNDVYTSIPLWSWVGRSCLPKSWLLDLAARERTCPACHGVGRVIKDPCKNCGGAGRVRRDKTLAVNIPAGVEDGMRIRLSGEGEAGVRGGPPGDLYIFLAVAPHPVFQRDGVDVSCRVPIPMTRAALGGTVEVPTLEGARVRLNIPAGTQSGHQFRLRSKGMPSVQGRGGRGDMYVIINVETPVNLSARQRELLEEFEREGSEGGTSSSPQSEGFFAKVKELWSDLTD